MQWKLWVSYLPTGIFMWNYTTFCNISFNSSGFSMLKHASYCMTHDLNTSFYVSMKKKTSNKSIYDSIPKNACHRMFKVKKTLNKIRSDRIRTFSLFHTSEYAADMEISHDISMCKSNWVLFLLEDYTFQTSSKIINLAPKILLKFPLTSRWHTENVKKMHKMCYRTGACSSTSKTPGDFLYSFLVTIKASILSLCTPDILIQYLKEPKCRFSKHESKI